MPATFVANGDPSWVALGYHVRVETPVQDRALFAADDPLAAEIHDWMANPRNGAAGLYGLRNVEPIDGDALANGVRYWFGFTEAGTAKLFQERWGKAAGTA